jgi:hypothetical protein
MITTDYMNKQDVMALGSLGSFPPKFNDMIWTTAGDSHKWGNYSS